MPPPSGTNTGEEQDKARGQKPFNIEMEKESNKEAEGEIVL